MLLSSLSLLITTGTSS